MGILKEQENVGNGCEQGSIHVLPKLCHIIKIHQKRPQIPFNPNTEYLQIQLQSSILIDRMVIFGGCFINFHRFSHIFFCMFELSDSVVYLSVAVIKKHFYSLIIAYFHCWCYLK